jgi:hypothetical protein
MPANQVFLSLEEVGPDNTVKAIAFEPGSKLDTVVLTAFWYSPFLKSVCLPASVSVLEEEKLDDYQETDLKHLTFEPGS